MKDIAKIAYVLFLNSGSKDEIKNLNDGVIFLRKSFPDLKIYLVASDILSENPFPTDCQFLKIPNQTFQNFSKTCNSILSKIMEDLVVFAEANTRLGKEDCKEFFNQLTHFEAVSPNSNYIFEIENLNKNPSEDLKKSPSNFANPIFGIQKTAFEKIGCWDERLPSRKDASLVLSHLIAHFLTNKSLNLSVFQKSNSVTQSLNQNNLVEEILTFSGKALEKYCQRLKKKTPEKTRKKKFILAVTTFNRKHYLQEFIETWQATRSPDFDWEIIIADDGSTDETLNYIQNLQIENTLITLIQNNRKDIIHQTNTIFRKLEKRDFDICFKCDDDVIFLKSGWDKLYWQTTERTGYQHLVYYNKDWRPEFTKSPPIQKGNLISYCDKEYLQGAFFTVSPNILKEVGFFDAYHLGFRGFEHNDFTLRCCRAGFNNLENPFDVVGSNNFIHLQPKENYVRAISLATESQLNTAQALAKKQSFLSKNRIYIPFNQISQDLHQLEASNQDLSQIIDHNGKSYRLANDRWISDRGIAGRVGSLLKRFYNFCLKRGWFWFPEKIKKMGLILLKIGNDLVNIDT